MKKLSMRLRYLLSYCLVLLPILVFALVLLFSTVSQGIQYTNTTGLQQFTYAMENIETIFHRIEDSTAGALSLRRQIVRTGDGGMSIARSDEAANSLLAMQEQLPDGISIFLYIQGGKDIYTTEGKIPYLSWEQKYANEYDLPMSKLYYSLATNRKTTLVPLVSAQDGETKLGFAYMTPFPTADDRQTVLVYLLHASVLETQFLNYLGQPQGTIYLYSTRDGMGELYAWSAGNEMLMPFNDMLHYQGVGLQLVSYQGRDLVLMRVSEPMLGLHCAMLVPYDTFYADTLGTQRLFVILIIVMVISVVVLALLSAFSIYRPISDLVEHIAGRSSADGIRSNELELIRTAYDHTVSEAGQLASYLTELMPVVTQQFVAKLIFGKIADREEFDLLCRTADIRFPHAWTAALYIQPISAADGEENGSCLDRCAVVISRFHPANVTVASGDMMSEQALCVVINFDAEPGQHDAECQRLANQLSTALGAEGISQVRIGVGRAYENPLQMPESFAEASAAVELAPASQQRVFAYSPQEASDAEPSESYPGVSQLTLALLSEGLHRGEKTVVLRALNDIMQEITSQTSSFVFFRFYCSELLVSIIRQAADLGITLDHRQRDSLIDYKSTEEFTEKAAALLESLCSEVRSRQQAQDDHIRRLVMDYILTNYKRFDFSLQMVSEDLGLRKNQITSVLKEELGQTFVQYVSFLRLNEFKRLLLETDQAIQTCVTEIGYSDVSNFLRKFKSVEGCTAGQYRALYQKGGDGAAE